MPLYNSLWTSPPLPLLIQHGGITVNVYQTVAGPAIGLEVVGVRRDGFPWKRTVTGPILAETVRPLCAVIAEALDWVGANYPAEDAV